MALELLTPWAGTDGTAATTASTGYDALTLTDAGATATWTDDWMPQGEIALRMAGSTSAGYAMGRKDIPATNTLAFAQAIKPEVLHSNAVDQHLFFFGAGETRLTAVGVTQDGIVRVRNAANTNAWSSPSGVMAVGVGCILSVYLVRDATAGQFRVVVYEEDWQTIRADSGLRTGQNTGSAAITRTRSSVAKATSSSTNAATYVFGRPRYDTAATGLLAPWTPPAAHSPLKMLINGQLTPVKARLGNGTSTGIPIL